MGLAYSNIGQTQIYKFSSEQEEIHILGRQPRNSIKFTDWTEVWQMFCSKEKAIFQPRLIIAPSHGLIGIYQVTAFFVMVGKISMLHNFEILKSCIVFQDTDNKFTQDFDFHGGQTWGLSLAIFSTSEIQALEKAS